MTFLIISLLCVYIASLLHCNRTLKASMAQVEEIAAKKAHFMNRLSHDIRTPLTAIMGLTELIADEADDGAAVIQDISQLKISGQYLLSLINDQLDLAKMENHEITVAPKSFSYEEFENQINGFMQPLCRIKRIDFTTERVNIPSCIKIDPIILTRIVMNLLSNALKFTDENGHIKMKVSGGDVINGKTHISILVIDNGCGMSADFQKNLYEPFVQDNSVPQKQPGTGLGLAITKKMVDLLHGTIEVKSEKGIGTQFTINFEVELCDAALTKPAISDRHYDALRGKTVLLFEDQDVNALIVTRLLEKIGIKTVHAENGQTGVELFHRAPPNTFFAVLTDIHMPVMGGIEAASAIRNMQKTDAAIIPIIVLSATSDETVRADILSSKIDGYLLKPIEPQKLYEILCMFI